MRSVAVWSSSIAVGGLLFYYLLSGVVPLWIGGLALAGVIALLVMKTALRSFWRYMEDVDLY